MDELPRKPRGRGPTWNRSIIDRAKSRRRLGDSIGEIERALKAEFREDVPTSTIKSWVAAVRPDPSGEWAIWHDLPEPDPAVVLPVLAAVDWSTGGRVTSITNEQARWITLLSRVRPDLKQNVYQLARKFIEAAQAKDADELRRQQSLTAAGAAREKWPGLDERITELHAKAVATIAAINAGANPFLDGRLYWPEDEQ